MNLGVRISSTETDRRPVAIHCLACERPSPAAEARDLRQTIFLLYVIPVFFHSPTLVECPCGASLVSSLKAKDLARVGDATFATRYLSVRIPPVLLTLVLGGIIAWLLPLIGTIWLGVAYAWSRRYSGWVRGLALVLFLLSLLPTSLLFFAT